MIIATKQEISLFLKLNLSWEDIKDFLKINDLPIEQAKETFKHLESDYMDLGGELVFVDKNSEKGETPVILLYNEETQHCYFNKNKIDHKVLQKQLQKTLENKRKIQL